MKCPKCVNIDLGKKSFSRPYACPECGGIWVRKEDLSRMSDVIFNDHEDILSDNNTLDSKTGLCPEGHGIMIRARIEDDCPFYLERCSVCGGIWFDRGEWQRIAGHHFLKNLSDFWSYSWQQRQRRKKSRRQYLQKNEELLGNELFASLVTLAEKLKQHPEKGRALSFLREEIERKETP